MSWEATLHQGGQAIFDLFVTLNPILLPEAKICVYLAMRNQCTCGKASHGIMVEACPDCGASSARIVRLKTFGLNDTRQGRGKAWATKTRLKAQPTSSKPNECPNGARAGPDLPINKSPDSAPAVGQESTSWSVLVLSSLFFSTPYVSKFSASPMHELPYNERAAAVGSRIGYTVYYHGIYSDVRAALLGSICKARDVESCCRAKRMVFKYSDIPACSKITGWSL
jgi:hypothetical protein